MAGRFRGRMEWWVWLWRSLVEHTRDAIVQPDPTEEQDRGILVRYGQPEPLPDLEAIPGYTRCVQCGEPIEASDTEPWQDSDRCAECLAGNGWKRSRPPDHRHRSG